jgi:cobalt-precorrin 5A hydrolase
VLVFDKDVATGHQICKALAARYRPSLVVYEKESPFNVLEQFDLIVAVMATGIVVRKLCKHLLDKWTDTPVVSVDSSLKCAVPVIGGHHGANDLALHLAEKLNLYPAITTATDAAGRPSLEAVASKMGAIVVNRDSSKEINLSYLRQDVPIIRLSGPKVLIIDDDVAVIKSRGGVVVGLGARKGVTSLEVVDAVKSALKLLDLTQKDIRVIATAWLKRAETGISKAAEELETEVIYLNEDVLNSQIVTTPSRAADLGLVGVAEPAALALSKKLVLPKSVYGRVTVALGE